MIFFTEEVIDKVEQTDLQFLYDLLNSELVQGIVTGLVTFFTALAAIIVAFRKIKGQANDIHNTVKESNTNLVNATKMVEEANKSLTLQVQMLQEENKELKEQIKATEKRMEEESNKIEIISKLPEAFKTFITSQDNLVNSGISKKICNILGYNKTIETTKEEIKED